MEEKRKEILRRPFQRHSEVKTIVFDTNILIDHVHGHAKWLDAYLSQTEKYILIIPTIVIAEFLTAAEEEAKEGKEKSQKYFSLFKIQDLTYPIADILGSILRRKTYQKGVSLADLIIASTAVHLDAELATRNEKDFKNIPGLRLFETVSV